MDFPVALPLFTKDATVDQSVGSCPCPHGCDDLQLHVFPVDGCRRGAVYILAELARKLARADLPVLVVSSFNIQCEGQFRFATVQLAE